MTAEAEPVKVFYSYAHEDEELRNELNKHLSLLSRQGLISEWHDRCITAGREWKNEIDQHLQEAQLILLLISPEFIASKYCYEIEMKQALDKHEARAARVVPIILRPTYWQNSPFSELNFLPTDAKPVTTWNNRDEAFLNIVQGICEIITELQAQPALGVPTAELRKCYLRIMADEWNTLRLQTLDSNVSDTRSRPVALEQVYVALDTTTTRSRPVALDTTETDYYYQHALSALSALCDVEPWRTKQERAEQPRIVLLGQPGSGKSTFARYVSFTLAKALLNPDTVSLKKCLPDWTGSALVPVIIPLGRLAANLVGDGAEDVAAAIRTHITTYSDLAGYGQVLLAELRETGGLVVFDGLDEVPGAKRVQIKTALGRFAAVYPQCRMLVTCRTHSYQHDRGWQLDWPAYELAPFSDEQIEAFITAWYAALSQRDPGMKANYQQKVVSLQAALARDDPRRLLELARTPLLLTVMAIVHAYKELPGSRVAVYRECVDILLKRWQKSRAEEGGRQTVLDALAPFNVTERQLEQGLCEVAYRAHEVGEAARLGGEAGRALVSGDTLRGVLYRWFHKADSQQTDAAVAVFLDYCQHANGLLLAQGSVATVKDGVPEPVYAFPHLSFEEYLAARHLRRLRVDHSSFTRKAAELASEPAWREVVRFLGEYLCHDKDGDIVYAKDLLEHLCPDRQPAGDPDWRRIWLAGELLADWRQEAAEAERDRELEKRIVKRMVELLRDPAACRDSLQVRLAVARVLAQQGDPRPGVGLRPDGLPDPLWVRIPGTATVRNSGQFPNFVGLKLGNGAKPDSDAYYDQTWPENAEPLEIADFELAAYPVTVAQFRPFIEQGGYQEDCYWSEAGRRWRSEGKLRTPRYWDDSKWTPTNHPVIGVSWYEAEAYCNWLNAQLPTDQAVRLPTEAEWEWVARGPEGRVYPWGDQWEAWRCNNSDLKIGQTSAVGAFPGGLADWWRVIRPESEGIHDLAGNVWEWTASEYTKDYSGAHRSVLNADRSGLRVLRGGSWFDGSRWVRGAARYDRKPHTRPEFRGFRLART